MPSTWTDYYKQGFISIAKSLENKISDKCIECSAEIMTSFNPRIHYRDNEYSPEFIFRKCLEPWNTKIDISSAIEIFFNSFELNPVIYNDTIDCIHRLKSKGYTICALTDIPCAMPDEYFKKQISQLLPYIDYYVSSQSCGYRKPNIRGMQMIANQYNADLKRIVFVGDELKDKKLAEKVGYGFFLIDRKNKNKVAALHNLSEIPDILPHR